MTSPDPVFAYEQALHRIGFMVQGGLVDMPSGLVDGDRIRDLLLDLLQVVRGALDE